MTAADWSLRLAQEADAPQFAEVEEDAATLLAEEAALAGIPIPPSRTPAQYAAIIRQRHSLSAVAGQRVIGFAAARPVRRELHLHEVSVARDFQRRGIATLLLRAMAVDARNSGFAAITLNTFRDVAWNAPFYERLGFVEVDDPSARPHLAAAMDAAAAAGLPRERRCAMIRFLD